jgi:hypothetical protein
MAGGGPDAQSARKLCIASRRALHSRGVKPRCFKATRAADQRTLSLWPPNVARTTARAFVGSNTACRWRRLPFLRSHIRNGDAGMRTTVGLVDDSRVEAPGVGLNGSSRQCSADSCSGTGMDNERRLARLK